MKYLLVRDRDTNKPLVLKILCHQISTYVAAVPIDKTPMIKTSTM